MRNTLSDRKINPGGVEDTFRAITKITSCM